MRNLILEPFPLETLSDIRATYKIMKSENELVGRPIVLVVEFSGKYRVGAAGAPDAQYMRGMAAAAIEALEPDAVILDFRLLDYAWGDEFETVYGTVPRGYEEDGRFAVVVGPQCKEAIRTLELGESSNEPLSVLPWAHESMEAAWDYLCARRAADEKQAASPTHH